MKSIFERPIFDSSHQIVCWNVRDEIRNERFQMSEWSIWCMNKNSLTLKHNTTGEYFLIGRRTFNRVIHNFNTPIKYVRQPHPKDTNILVKWIKLDTK